MPAPAKTRAGFVVLVGAANAGKSTLLNALVGAKLSIVTHKAQTTRSAIRGIAMHATSQIIFVDTPGIFDPPVAEAVRRLDRAMLRAAWQSADNCDMALLVHDSGRKEIDQDTLAIADKLEAKGIAKALVLNKIDLVAREKLLGRTKRLTDQFAFAQVFMVSASKADGTDAITPWLAQHMPESPYLYDPEDLSDLPDRLMAAEVLREQLFLHLHAELPYQLTVETESWQRRDDGSVDIHCRIIIANRRHQGMILGAGGKHIARIGKAARLEMEALFDCRVHLKTQVQVKPNWLNDPARYRPWGLEYNA